MIKKKKKPELSSYERTTRKISRSRSIKRHTQTIFRRGYYGAGLVMIVMLMSASWWWVHSGKFAIVVEGGKEMVLAQTAKAGLSLQYIFLQGREKAKRESVIASLGLEAGDPILGVSVTDIHDRIEQIGWVKEVVVERQLPDTLHIQIIERRPIALWQNEGKLHLVDDTGKVIDEASAHDKEYGKLLLVVGKDAPIHTVELARMLHAQPELAAQVASAIRVGERRWNVRFTNGVEVKLPANNPERAWSMLAEMDKQQQVLERNIRSVDLRLEDRIFIDLPPDAHDQITAPAPKNAQDT